MTVELVIPEATSIVPAGFAKQARAQLQEWNDLDVIDETRHRLAALEKYVKDKASRFEVQAATRWAEVRIGELLDVRNGSNSLASDNGQIAKDDRHRFRLLAEHVLIVEECIEEKAKASRKFILDEIKKRLQREPLPVTPTVQLADAIDWLPRQPICDLLLTDPPYSTDVDDVERFARQWLPLALAQLKPSGRAYVCVGAYPEELRAYLNVATGHFMLSNVLVWTYRNTLGPTPSHDYKLNWQAVLYYRGPEAAPLECPVMTEQFTVQDINAPDGRQGNRWHAWQKPDELGERFVRHSTHEGDLVLDPFAGTGAFLLAAGRLGRRAAGSEIDPDTLSIAVQRGCQVAQ